MQHHMHMSLICLAVYAYSVILYVVHCIMYMHCCSRYILCWVANTVGVDRLTGGLWMDD